jgi:hypothetical protein
MRERVRAETTDVTLTFPCDPRFVDTMRTVVSMAVTSVGCSEASGQAAAKAVEAFVAPELTAPHAPPVVVEVTGTRARLSVGSRHLTVDL